MSNDKAFKIKNGITVGGNYQQTGGTVTSSNAGLDVKSANLEGSLYFSQPGTTGADIFFKPDGTKLYMQSNSTVYQYSLSTAWDITTASYDSKSLVVESGGNLNGFFIGDSGTKLYGLNDGNYYVRQYNLSTAWDVSSGSFDDTGDAGSGLPSGVYSGARTVNFSSDGTKLYVHFDQPTGSVYQYTLSTAWDINTLSYSKRSIPILSVDDELTTGQDGYTYGIRFSTDGTEMFMAGKAKRAIYKFGLTTAWDIGTLYYTGESTPDYFLSELANSSVAVENNISGIALNTEDGDTFYLRGQQRGTVLQYRGMGHTKTLDLSTGNYFKVDLTTGTNIAFSNPPPSGVAYAATIEIESGGEYNIQSGYMAAVVDTGSVDGESTVNGVTFKTDGTKMYQVGQSQDVVHQWSLSVPWDVSSATYETEISVSTSGTTPTCVRFKSDGTIMYVLNSNTDSVYQYDLRIPWDVSTTVLAPGSFSVNSQETVPNGLYFKTDGTKMFVTGSNGDDLNEYALSTAWDVTSATFTQVEDYPEWNTTSFAAQNPTDIAFSADGTRIFVVSNNVQVISFPLSTAWDISTMGNMDRFYNASSGLGIGNAQLLTSIRGIELSSDGTKFFLTGQRAQYFTGTGTTEQTAGYNIASPFKLSWPNSIKWDQNVVANPPDAGSKCFYTILTVDGGSTYYGKVSGGHVG